MGSGEPVQAVTNNMNHKYNNMNIYKSKLFEPSFPRAQYLTAEERAAVAAHVDSDGLLRFVGSGELVHTLSPEESAELAADPAAWRAAEQAAAAMARGGDEGATEVRVRTFSSFPCSGFGSFPCFLSDPLETASCPRENAA